MSIISNRSSVVKYTSGETQALSGQQLIIAHYKTDKTTGIKPDSKAVSLPLVTNEAILESISGLYPAIQKLVYDAKVEMFKDALEENPNMVDIEQTKLDLSAVITYLNETVKSERISKDSISAWFDNTASSYLSVPIATKLGITAETPETSEKYLQLNETLESYKVTFAKFAGVNVSLSNDAIQAVKKALSFITSENDNVKQYILAKIDKITNQPKADLLAL